MSRTPLFRLVQRSYALARESPRTGVPVDEVVEREREARITRRGFLGGTAAAAGLALASRPLRAFAAPVRQEEVLVVGAGIAGLTAAWRLHQAGVPVRVLEAQDRAGGRMFSLRGFFPDGQVCELGGELIDTGHVHLRALAEELEIPLDDFVLDDFALSRDLFFFEGRRIGEAEVVQAFLPVSDRMVRDLAAIGGSGADISYREPNGAEELDRTPMTEWLDRSGATGWFRKLLDVAFTTELGLETDRQSALNLLLILDPNPAPFRIYGASDERFHVRGGNDRIPLELARRMGPRIETGTRLEAVSKAADGSFRCSVRSGSSSRELRARHVVLTLPFTHGRGLRDR